MIRPPELNHITMEAIIVNEPADITAVLQYLDEADGWIQSDLDEIGKQVIDNRIEIGKLEAKQHNMAYQLMLLRRDLQNLTGSNIAMAMRSRYDSPDGMPPASASMQEKQVEIDAMLRDIEAVATRRQEVINKNHELDTRSDELIVFRERTRTRLRNKRELFNTGQSSKFV